MSSRPMSPARGRRPCRDIGRVSADPKKRSAYAYDQPPAPVPALRPAGGEDAGKLAAQPAGICRREVVVVAEHEQISDDDRTSCRIAEPRPRVDVVRAAGGR